MTKLSVNINKIAVIRNSRGGNLPDVVRAALDIERFGGEGITVHPRPDERPIRYPAVRNLRALRATEFNIGIRTSIFVDPDPEMVRGAKVCGADRVELYTEAYAAGYHSDREAAIAPYVAAAEAARECGLGLNAGHDLNLDNLRYFVERIPWCDEVSIGHALISDALYYGLENTVQLYKREIELATSRGE